MGKNKTKNRATVHAANQMPGNVGAKLIAVILLAAIVAYFVTALALGIRAGAPVWNPLKWVSKTTPTARTIAISADGSEIKNGGKYSMASSEVNGIMYLSEAFDNQTYVPDGEIIVTTELSNEYINGAFDWGVKFADENAEWAVGKVADDFVSVEVVIGNSTSAKLHYLAPFEEQIILTATLRGGNSSDSCTIDCLKPVTSFRYMYANTDFGYTASVAFYQLKYGVGTVTGDLNFDSVCIKLTNNFISAFKSYLKFDVNIKSPSFTASDVTEIGADGRQVSFNSLLYSMFIDGFDDYDEAHKEAIYYAWWTAYNDVPPNITFDCKFNYVCNGVKITELEEINSSNGYITGSRYGSKITPNTQLNKNYVF